MSATFMNGGMVLSMGVFFSLMIAGLAQSLPQEMTAGLTRNGVPEGVAHQLGSLPPVGTLFAAAQRVRTHDRVITMVAEDLLARAQSTDPEPSAEADTTDTDPQPSAEADSADPELTDAELAARLRLTLARLHRRLRQQTPHSLTAGQVSALASVEELEPVRLSELAGVEGISLPTLSKLVAGLETQRLLVRKPDPDDGRAARLQITEAGREELERLRTERSAFLIERLGTLTGPQRAALIAALDALQILAKGERCQHA